MFRFTPLVLAIQGFCLYHAYKNNSEQRWYWIIIILPFIGSAMYLYHHFYSRQNVEGAKEGLKGILNTNHEIDKLEKAVDFAETEQNKTLLGDAYMKYSRFEDAAKVYESCLNRFNRDDFKLISRIVAANAAIPNYVKAVEFGESIASHSDFKKSEAYVSFVWSLYNTGDKERAERLFKRLDVEFTNYAQRLAYCQMLIKGDEVQKAGEKLETMVHEFDQMESIERKHNSAVAREIKTLLNSLK